MTLAATPQPPAGPPVLMLCAGYGTRMGTLTATTPKPLLEVAGRPVLDHLVEQLLPLPRLGTLHVVSNHHYASAFEAWAAGWNLRLGERRVQVHDDGSRSAEDRLGAIGDLAFVAERLTGEALAEGALVTAGDNIFRFSLAPLWRGLTEHRETTVLALHEADRQRLQRTGVLELDDDQRVLRLHEKPQDPPSSWACPSIYGLRPEALGIVDAYLSAGHSSDEIGRFIAHLVSRQIVRAVPTEGERLHVGSPQELRHADQVLRDQVLRDQVLRDR